MSGTIPWDRFYDGCPVYGCRGKNFQFIAHVEAVSQVYVTYTDGAVVVDAVADPILTQPPQPVGLTCTTCRTVFNVDHSIIHHVDRQ